MNRYHLQRHLGEWTSYAAMNGRRSAARVSKSLKYFLGRFTIFEKYSIICEFNFAV